MPVPAQPDRFTFLHIDLNSFFASVEQQLHPEYRGKPLGVCGTMADTGALIAASYEAKALGIRTLTKVGEAKRLCPGDHPGERVTYGVLGVFAPDRGGGGALLPGGAYAVDRRDGVPADRARVRAAQRKADCARGQAGYQGRCGRDAAVLDRYGAKPVFGQDCERHAKAGRTDRPAALAASAGDCAPGAAGPSGSRRADGGSAAPQGDYDDGAAAGARPAGNACAVGFSVGRPAVSLAARRRDGR